MGNGDRTVRGRSPQRRDPQGDRGRFPGWLSGAWGAVVMPIAWAGFGLPQGAIAQSVIPAMQSQMAAPTWQQPPRPIDRMLNAPQPPVFAVSPNHRYAVELGQSGLGPISKLAQPEVALAGLTINPNTNGPSVPTTYRWVTVVNLPTGDRRSVSLPPTIEFSNVLWSRDGRYLAATNGGDRGLELWVIDLESATARQLTGPILNGAYGAPCHWLPDDAGLVCKVIPADRGGPPVAPSVAMGPIVEENDGRRSPDRTYTNLLKNPHDERLLTYYLTAAIERIDLQGGRSPLLGPDLYDEVTPSPDGQYLLVETIRPPFSYKVPIERFAAEVSLYDIARQRSSSLAQLPLADNLSLSFDAVRSGRREFGWRTDRPATLYWVEALDGGNPEQPATYRDALYTLDAATPDRPPTRLWQSTFRFRQVWWGNDETALISDLWFDQRRTRLWQVAPGNPTATPTLRVDRNYQDRYHDPGAPLMTQGPYGMEILRIDPDQPALYFSGDGASPRGIYPFLDRWNLATNRVDRLWQSADPYYEYVVELLDNGQQFITQRQSQTDPPNYILHDRRSPDRPSGRPLTQYADPIPDLAGIHKEIVHYQRADGVTLSATLYLPPGYKKDRDGPLPMLFWVYPEEYADRNTAGQVSISANTFSRPQGDSPLFLLALGYGILLDPSLPIVGENGAEPNDTYIEQLIAGAQAAVNYVVGRGIADRSRLVVGGHSYGAFTVANLLAHTNLFKAGIARSGAYNRTLTPFGFQGEQRDYWQARDTYTRLSPFTFADRINEPLLLIHGQKDSNPGTYPIQSERMYDALRGLGGTARLVLLPYEDHGYESQEATGHVLWEMARWCDLYIGTSTVRRLRLDLQQAHLHP